MNISHKHKNQRILYLVVMILSILTTACGGGSDNPNPGGSPDPKPTPTPINRTLTGTAATGTAVTGTVTIVDAVGNLLTTQSDASGAYSINLGPNKGPYLIRIVPNNSNLQTLYSYATNSGVANITQFTSLALVLAFQNLGNAFSNWATTVSTWDRATVEQALA